VMIPGLGPADGPAAGQHRLPRRVNLK
jgi:hypothetical protein